MDELTDDAIYHPLLGKQAAVRLDPEGQRWVEGVLLKLTVSGEADVLLDDGRINYCWPALAVVARNNRVL